MLTMSNDGWEMLSGGIYVLRHDGILVARIDLKFWGAMWTLADGRPGGVIPLPCRSAERAKTLVEEWLVARMWSAEFRILLSDCIRCSCSSGSSLGDIWRVEHAGDRWWVDGAGHLITVDEWTMAGLIGDTWVHVCGDPDAPWRFERYHVGIPETVDATDPQDESPPDPAPSEA